MTVQPGNKNSRDDLVVMENVSKAFPGVQALDNCRFNLRRGEVHALVGENGAGKSTLVKCLAGIYRADAGRIVVGGKDVNFSGPADAARNGIAIIHQELNLMPHLTIAQNIFMGREFRGRSGLTVDHRRQQEEACRIMASVRLDEDPSTRVSELTVAKQQLVEISRALAIDSDILVMDEPTASLTDREIDELFSIIEELRTNGTGIIYISHRMEELGRISDRTTVMRDGKYIDTVSTASTPVDRIIAMMVGRELYEGDHDRKVGGGAGPTGPTLLEVKNLSAGSRVRDVSFKLNAGEIMGVAGLVGAGRTEMARCVFGADKHDCGEIRVNGEERVIRSPRDAIRAGISYLSEDRKRYGLILDLDVAVNTVMASLDRFIGRFGGFARRKAAETGTQYLAKLRIKSTGPAQRTVDLSGGNQQKVIIGKWLLRDTDVMIFDEPTRGIDIGAKDEIYRLLDDLAAQGRGIIMISSELPEILRMSHRVLVMCDGRITGEFSAGEATQEKIMECAVRFE